MSWFFLSLAIIFEVVGTMSLRTASSGRPRYYGLVAGGYVLSYAMLSVALVFDMPLGVAYGIWSAIGVAATAILGRLLFNERFTWIMGLGVVLVMAGVLLVETGAY